MNQETTKIGKRGAIIIPSSLRKKYGFTDGSLVVTEERDDGILIRSAVAIPVEDYTPKRIAEFLLSSAVDAEDYEDALTAVREMGLDPDQIPHSKPERTQ